MSTSNRTSATGQTMAFRHAMPDYDVTHEDLIVQGDRVAVRNTVSGTHQGAFMGIEPTGKHIEIRTAAAPSGPSSGLVTSPRTSTPSGGRARILRVIATREPAVEDLHQVRDGKITYNLEDFAGLMAQLNAPADAPSRRPPGTERRRQTRSTLTETVGLAGR